VVHESQVVDPGREYWDGGHVWQCVAREVLEKVPGGHAKHLHVPAVNSPGEQSPHCNDVFHSCVSSCVSVMYTYLGGCFHSQIKDVHMIGDT
jgi:hypothetical protein